MSETTAETEEAPRLLRVCDICGGVDDGPRHRIGYGPGDAPPVRQDLIKQVLEGGYDTDTTARAIAELNDTTVRSAHLDCCADNGCFDRSCDEVRKIVGDDLKDDDLLEALTSGDVDHVGVELTEKRAEVARAQAEADHERREAEGSLTV